MITAARLSPQNKRIGHALRSYTSGRGNKYNAGQENAPAPWRVVQTPAEIAELTAIAQFQVRTFESIEALRSQISADMEADVRAGKPPVRASIIEDEKTVEMTRVNDEGRSLAAKASAADAARLLTPTPIGDEAEPVADVTFEEDAAPELETAPVAEPAARHRGGRKPRNRG